jgi:hypothetical protein
VPRRAARQGCAYKVEKLAWQAMTAVKDTECQEKKGIVEHYAAALYSESEHHKWRMVSLPGSDFLRLQILRALVAFNGRLLAIEAARRNGIDLDQPPLRADDVPRDPKLPLRNYRATTGGGHRGRPSRAKRSHFPRTSPGPTK